MTKLIIDAFDTQEQAVAFANWLIGRFKNNVPKLMCIKEDYYVRFDGVDTHSSNKEQLVINVEIEQAN